jgi:VCBS repeat-containing protein
MLMALASMLAAAMALSGVAQAGASTTTTLASPTQIGYVCVNKSSGQLFYLASCTKSQTKTDVTSSSTQFKACYQTSNGVTRKVPESTKCSNKTTNKELTIEKVPADSSSLYFCVKASDGTMYYKPGTTQPTCPTGQYAVVIGPHNQAPSAVGETYSTAEDTPLTVAVASGVLANDSDPDGDTITAQLATGPSHGTLTLNPDGSFSYTPDADYNGTDPFTYTAKDSHNILSVAATVSITVNAVDDPPVALGDSMTVSEDSGQTPIDVLANDTDVDGGTMQIASVGNPAHGKVVVAGDSLSLSYEPAADYCGRDSFSYTLNDGSTANVSVAVDCVNDAPVANDDSATVESGGTLVGGGNVLTNDTDVDGDALNAVLVSGPSHGTLTLNPDGSFSYTHDGGDTTSDSFTYKASDGTADSNVATATITVTTDALCKTLAIQTLGSSFNPANYTFHGGTATGDTFTGTAGQSEVFCGFGGDDSIGTLQAGDIFLGGDGQDKVATNNGTFYGDAGGDYVTTNYGTFYGGDGIIDTALVNYGTFNGGAGDDYVTTNYGTFNQEDPPA